MSKAARLCPKWWKLANIGRPNFVIVISSSRGGGAAIFIPGTESAVVAESQPEAPRTISLCRHETVGIDMAVTSDHIIVLDCQPVLSPSVILHMIQADGKPPASHCDWRSFDNLVEVQVCGPQPRWRESGPPLTPATGAPWVPVVDPIRWAAQCVSVFFDRCRSETAGLC